MKMRAIKIRGDLFNARQLGRAIENALDGAAKAAKVDFDTTTKTWKKRPQFSIEEQPGQRTIATDDEIYGYVDQGTDPHVIVAKGRALVFSPGGRPKSVPNAIRANKGSSGTGVVFRRRVQHPGSKPRNFAKTIKQKWDDDLPKILQRAIDSEVR